MAYDKTQWSDNATALSAQNMNHIEQGIKDAHDLIESVASMIYPVGSIYMSATLSTAEEVAAIFGGTWVAWGEGRVPVGFNADDTNFNASEKEGGSADAIVPSHNHSFSGSALGNHSHSVSGHTHPLPDHRHTTSNTQMRFLTANTSLTISADSGSGVSGEGYKYPRLKDESVMPSPIFGKEQYTGYASNLNTYSAGATATNASAGTPSGTISTVGEAVTGKNLQPYITCYMFKRTA